ncbi:MAG: hypothetical protein WCG09_07915 [Halobacteriota archaeon]
MENVEMLNNSKTRQDLVLRMGELVDYFTELKTKLDNCNMNELPEDVIIRANSALNWLCDLLFLNTPEGLEELQAYLDPEYWDDLDLDEIEGDEDDTEE